MNIMLKKAISIILVMLMVVGGLNGLFVGGGKAYAAVSFAGGAGTSDDPYQIATPAQLDEVRNHLEAGIYFELTADIDLTDYLSTSGAGYNGGAGWLPIGDWVTVDNPFQGNMDGNGYTITGLMINRPDLNSSVGLFGYIENARLSNMRLENVHVIGRYYVGSLVGDIFSGTVISNSSATGSVSGTDYNVGGLVGYNSNGTITNSTATVSVSGTSNVGGLVGNIYDVGSVISNSSATGSVSGTSDVGGLVGSNYYGTVSSSYATGSVSGTSSNVGGLVGFNNFSGSVSRSYAIGSVSGDGYVGGLVGFNDNGTVSDSYASVSGTSSEAGLVGYSSVTISDSSFYEDITGQEENMGKGVPQSTADMKAQNTYTGASWDFENTWGINSSRNNGYPYLQVFKTITYNSNGGTGNVPLDLSVYPQGVTASVYGNIGNLVKTDYAFAGWNMTGSVSDAVYAAGYSFTIEADTTLYAVWKSTTATLTSTIGTVSTGGTANETITNIPTATTLAELKAAITLAAYATYEVYEADGITPATTLVTGNKVIVTAQDGVTKVTYTVTVIAVLSTAATLTSTIGTVSTGGTANETITNISNATMLAELKAAITPAANATFEVYDADGTTVATTLATGKKVIVTAQDGITTVTYTLTVNAAAVTPSTPSGGGSVTPTNNTLTSTDGTLTLPVGRTGEVSLVDEVTVSIPADAADKELKLTIEKLSNTQNLLNKEVLVSPVFEILKNFPENFKKSVKLTFTFDPASLKGNQKPVVFYYDEVKKVWVEVGGIVNGNKITVDVNHFTKFAVIAVGQAKEEPAMDPSTNFSDISGNWAEVNIKKAVSSGIVNGYLDGTFKPGKTVTRAEFAVMLMNALKPQEAGAELTFTDSAKIGTWAQKAVAQAVQAGIIKGYKDGSFRPNAEITRTEMAVMIANALNLSIDEDIATGFADDMSIPSWAKGAVAAIKELGIMTGTGTNQFNPNAQATRAEAVTVLLNMLAQIEQVN